MSNWPFAIGYWLLAKRGGPPGGDPPRGPDFASLGGYAEAGTRAENTSETEPLVCLRYFGPEVNPEAPAMGAYRKQAKA